MTATAGGIWAFHWHLGAWLLVGAAAILYLIVTRDRGPAPATARQRTSFLLACALLAVALSWPVADLGAHTSLSALVLQRLLLMLAVPALVLLGVPEPVLARLTRPAPIDRAVSWLSRPAVAVAVVTVVAVGTLTTGAVELQSTSAVGRAALDVALLLAGTVLWLPFLAVVPGTRRLSPLGGAAYLVVQSIVPSFLSVVWIFARHPLYPTYAHGPSPAGMSPLLDQQLAGFVAKLATIALLWTVAFVSVRRGVGDPEDESAHRLTWADVERQLLRVERRERRLGAPPPTDPLTGGMAEEGGPPETG